MPYGQKTRTAKGCYRPLASGSPASISAMSWLEHSVAFLPATLEHCTTCQQVQSRWYTHRDLLTCR